MAAAAGIQFSLLGNGAVVTIGLNGATPPCLIASVFENTHVGRRPLNISGALDVPPRSEVTTEMPPRGPPVLLGGYYPTPTGVATVPVLPKRMPFYVPERPAPAI